MSMNFSLFSPPQKTPADEDDSTNVPTVSGASARANFDRNGVVTGITILNPGSGYTSAPAVGWTGYGGNFAQSDVTFGVALFRTQLWNLRKQFSHLPKVLKALDTFEVMGALAKNPAIEVFNTRIFGPLTALMYQAEPQGPYTFWGEEQDRYYNDAGQPLEMETQST